MKIHHLYAMLSVLAFLSCKITENKPVAAPIGFDWQGHRGCRGLMPENTIPAFLRALEYPQVRTLELDLAVSKDNQLIVSHEPWFNPAICLRPNGDSISASEESNLLLYQLKTADIQAFDCGSKGNKRFPEQKKLKAYKPTLRELVESVKSNYPERFSSIRWNIEIKSQATWDGVRHPAVDEFAKMVIRELRELSIDRNSTVQSFDIRALESMHRQAPDIVLAFLIENAFSIEHNLKMLTFTPQIYSPYYMTISRKSVKTCHKRGMKLVPWTVNDVSAMRRLIRLGVDGIITDYPNRIGEAIGAK